MTCPKDQSLLPKSSTDGHFFRLGSVLPGNGGPLLLTHFVRVGCEAKAQTRSQRYPLNEKASSGGNRQRCCLYPCYEKRWQRLPKKREHMVHRHSRNLSSALTGPQ